MTATFTPHPKPVREPKPPRGPRQRKCAVCRSLFVPRSITHKACGAGCALAVAEVVRKVQAAKVARADRAKTRAQLRAIETAKDKKKRLQPIVNAIARARDHADGCISCDKPANWGGQWHGSHYKSSGSNSALTFNLWNIHKACSECNRNKGGNIHGYRPRLIEKCGAACVEWLDNHPRSREYDPDYLERAIAIGTKWLNRKMKRLANK